MGRLRAVQFVAGHALVALLLLLGSEALVGAALGEPARGLGARAASASAFVGAASLLLYALLRRLPGDLAPAPAASDAAARGWLPVAALAALALAASLAGGWYARDTDFRHNAAHLEEFAAMRGEQAGAWMAKRRGDARYLAATWPADNRAEAEAGAPARKRIDDFRAAEGLASVYVLQAGPRPVSVSGRDPAAAPGTLEAALASAAGEGRPFLAFQPARADAEAVIVIAEPLAARAGRSAGALVLEIDPGRDVDRLLRGSTVDATAGDLLLARREGDRIRPFWPARPEVAAPLAADSLATGVDARAVHFDHTEAGSRRHGVAVPVPGTDWLVVALAGRDALAAGGDQAATALAIIGLLVVLAAFAGMLLLRQRYQVAEARLRVSAQAEKLRSLQLLEAVAESSADMIFAKDREGRYTVFNREACRVTGRRREDVIGRDDSALLPPGECGRAREADREIMDSGETRSSEQRLDTADGPATFLATRGPLRDGAGAIVGLFGIARDITARKREEDAIHENQQRLELALQAAGMGVWEWDTRGGRLYASPQALRIAGDDDIPNEPVGEFLRRVHPEDAARLAAEARDAVLRRRLLVAQFRVVRSDGETRWVSCVARARHDESGAPVRMVGTIQDVTERRRLEAGLQESERKLRLFMDNAPAAIAMLDRDLRYVFASRRWLDDYGLGDGDIVGRSHYEIFPEIPDQWREIHRRCLAGAVERRDEDPFRRADGSIDWVKWEIRPWHDAGGEIGGIIVMSETVTARMNAERALRESEASLRSTVSVLTEGIIVFDASGRVASCNASAERILRLSRDELQGSPAGAAPWRFVREDGTPACAGDLPFAATLATGGPRRGVTLGHVSRDGATTWLLVNSEPVVDARHALTAVVASFTDITARHAAQAELRKLSLAVEQSPSSVVISDAHGNIEFVNAAFTRVSGYRADEVLGRNPRLLQSGRTPPETYRSLWSALKRGESWKGEFVNRRKCGEEYVEVAIVSPVREPDGRVTHYLAIKDDVTERKRIGDELDRHRHHLEELVEARTRQIESLNAELASRAEQAEGATRAKSAFLANMSHEIRTPLNAIIGFAHILQRRNADAGQARGIERISEAAGHLLQIINDILDLSKIEAGKFSLSTVDFDLHDALAHARAFVADRAAAKGLALRVDAAGLPRRVHGDATRLTQALLNYLGNAVKFTDRGTVALGGSVVDEDEGGMLVRFEVLDTGIGIAPEALPRLFEAFEQVDDSATRRHGGSGLGLAITRHLARLMGGAAGASSEPGRGSAFWFTARLGRPAASADEPPQALAGPRGPGAAAPSGAGLLAAHRGARVLIAEDNSTNLEVALELLREAGLVVDAARTGAEAVACARSNAYDVILMDMQMPVMDGLDATRAIREIDAHAGTPILALTANAFAEGRAACLAAGMNDHIPKPVDPGELYRALLRWLGRGGEERPGAAEPLAPDAARGAIAGLEGVPGLDAHRGLRALDGRDDAYLRILRRFCTRCPADLDNLRNLLEAGRHDELRRAAHSLKGSAGTVGATAVQALAMQLEAALGRQSAAAQLRPLVEELGHETRALALALAGRLPPEAAARPPAGDGGRELLDRIEGLLAAADFSALADCRDAAALLDATLGPASPAFRQHLHACDFDRALALLRAARGASRAGAATDGNP